MTVWVAQTSSFGTTNINAVAYGGGKYCAVGDSGKVATSTDGVTWTQQTTAWAGGSNSILSILWDGSQFVAAGVTGASSSAGTSSDGVTWTLHTLPGTGTPFRNAIAFGLGLYLIGKNGSNGYWTSPDGATWTARTVPSPYSIYGLIFDGTDFVAGFGNGISATPQVAYSSDGLSWSFNPLTSFFAGDDPYVAYNGTSIYVAVEDAADNCETSASRVWAGTQHTPGLDPGGLFCVAYGGGLFATADGIGGVATSPDGATWTVETLSFTAGNSANDIAYGGGQFVAVGTAGQLSTRSVGPPTGTVPNVLGDSQTTATVAITGAGFTLGPISSAYSITVPVGRVVSQVPVGGSTAILGSTVAITLSLGPQEVAVPNLIGMTAADANNAIIGAGLTSGTISGITSDSVPIGDVAAQSPAAGTEVLIGTAVDYDISFIVPEFDVDATVISQYANSPTILAMVADFAQWFDPAANLQNFYLTVWNIDTAQGFGLDIWGIILNVSRVIPIPGTSGAFGFYNSDVPPDWENFGNVDNPASGGPFYGGQVSGNSYKLADGPYRVLLLTKALANICATTAPALNALITNLFPGRGRCYTRDLGAMTMSYVFEFALTSIEFAILAFSGVLAHPAGVGVNINVLASGFFGFEETGAGVQPFDFGAFYGA